MNITTTQVSTSPAQIVASIDDLLIEIFIRLPLKPLIRFKSISKHWNSLISNPKLHDLRDRQPNPAVGLIFQCQESAYHDKHTRSHSYFLPFHKLTKKLKLTQHPFDYRTKILHSCNGLLLCGPHANQCYWKYYVYNPTTKKSSILPQPHYEQRGYEGWSSIRGMFLAFDPSESRHYKVVCVRRLEDIDGVFFHNQQYQFEVYSSEIGCWRKCDECFTSAHVDFNDGVYWNGAIHWISLNKPDNSIYFNPDIDQMPKVMPVPPVIRSTWKEIYYFGESCGHLHFVVERNTQSVFSVQEMRRDYSEWFVKYRVDLSDILSDMYSLVSLSTLVRGNKDEDAFLVVDGEKILTIQYR